MITTEIIAALNKMEAAGAPQWKLQLAFESMQAARTIALTRETR